MHRISNPKKIIPWVELISAVGVVFMKGGGVQSKSTDGNRQEVDGGRTDPASNTPQSCPQVLPAQSQVGGKKVHKSISSQVHKSTDLASTVSGGWEERSTEFGTICSPEDIWVHLGDRLQRNIAPVQYIAALYLDLGCEILYYQYRIQIPKGQYRDHLVAQFSAKVRIFLLVEVSKIMLQLFVCMGKGSLQNKFSVKVGNLAQPA